MNVENLLCAAGGRSRASAVGVVADDVTEAVLHVAGGDVGEGEVLEVVAVEMGSLVLGQQSGGHAKDRCGIV